MPSQTHADLLLLFRDQPGIAAEALRQALPEVCQSSPRCASTPQSLITPVPLSTGRIWWWCCGKAVSRRYVAEGEIHGRAALILMQLAQRFSVLPESVHERISKASIEELDAIGRWLLDAKTLQEALGSR